MRRGWPLVRLAGAGLDLPTQQQLGLASGRGFEQRRWPGSDQHRHLIQLTTRSQAKGWWRLAAEAFPLASQQAMQGGAGQGASQGWPANVSGKEAERLSIACLSRAAAFSVGADNERAAGA